MNLIAPRDVYAEEGPGVTLPAPPHPMVSSNVVEPRISAPLPGQDIVDAINAENLAFANQHPGQDLTDVFNRQAALRTGNDLANMRSAEVEREARAAVVQNQFMNNALEQHPNSPPPGYQDQAAPAYNPIAHWPDPMSIRDAGVDYGPGLTPAAAEELYGPGGMYGTQPLAGGLYDQMGISPAGMGSSPTGMGSTTPTKTASQHLADEINTIKRKAGIIRGTAALFGGNPKAADRYEAKALASLKEYAGHYALSQLTDEDFKNNQTLFSRLIELGAPASIIPTVMNMGLVVQSGDVVDLHNHDTGDVWTGRIDSDEFNRKIASGNWHKSARAKGSEKPKINATLATSDAFTPESKAEYLKTNDSSVLVVKPPTAEPTYKDAKEVREVEATFRKEYITGAKDYRSIVDFYSKALAARDLKTGAGDIAIIFNYMKMLDPRSVVREGEQATAQNAGGVDRRWRNWYNKVRTGQMLPDEVRQEILQATDSLFREQYARHQRYKKQYTDLAINADVDATQVVLEYAPRITEDGQEWIVVGTRKVPATLVLEDKRNDVSD